MSDEFNTEFASDGSGAVAQAKPEGDGLPIGTIFKLLVAGLVVAAIVIFVLQNLDNVPVDFLSFSFDAPLILLLAVAAVAGVLVRWIFSFWRSRR
jgi:uncharacterized integral membrane protein